MPRFWIRSHLKEISSSNWEHLDIPFSCNYYFKKEKNKKTYATLFYTFNGLDPDTSRITVFGRLKCENGGIQDFRRDLDLKKKENEHSAMLSIPLNPCTYNAYLGVRIPGSSKYSVKNEELIAPDFWNDKLSKSQINKAAYFQVID